MKLNELKENKGAFKTKKRLGRGPGSGVGKHVVEALKGKNQDQVYLSMVLKVVRCLYI